MKCPRCHTQHYSKNGLHKGKQKYICKNCGRQWLATIEVRGYPDGIRQLCLTMYRNGLMPKKIAQYSEISYTTIMNWIKQSGLDSESSSRLDVLEITDQTQLTANHDFITKSRSS